MALCQSGLMDGSAKPWFAGSNPAGASKFTLTKGPRDTLSSVQKPTHECSVFVLTKKIFLWSKSHKFPRWILAKI